MSATWRLFIAVPLPPPVISLVGGIVADLATTGWPVRWIAPESAHITLQFIGEVSPEHAELLRIAVPPVIAKHAAFRLRTADLGVFPNQRRPRVIWLGLYGPAHRLQTLQTDLAELLASLNIPADDGEFHPHITLGRVRDTRNMSMRDLPSAIQRKLTEIAASGDVNAKNPRPVPIEEVVLYRSVLSHSGPRYEAIARCPLTPQPSRHERGADR